MSSANSLPLDFYNRDTITVARELLGKLLVHKSPQGTAAGVIIETEAYLFPHDPASHSFRGKTKRNAPMFEDAGRAYVYFTYGMHHCFNVVTMGEGEAVLIRALKPSVGVDLMKKRRRNNKLSVLTNGPANLAQAMGIDIDLNRADLINGLLYIMDQPSVDENFIITTFRIGISRGQDMPLRYVLRQPEV